ncbi:hypothetical protein D3C76_1493990 [compost metagenome]
MNIHHHQQTGVRQWVDGDQGRFCQAQERFTFAQRAAINRMRGRECHHSRRMLREDKGRNLVSREVVSGRKPDQLRGSLRLLQQHQVGILTKILQNG